MPFVIMPDAYVNHFGIKIPPETQNNSCILFLEMRDLSCSKMEHPAMGHQAFRTSLLLTSPWC